MNKSLRIALLSGAAIIGVLAVDGAVFAQDAGAQDGADAQTIVVTGTRVRSTFTTPTPVTVVSTEDLQAANPGNLVEAIVQLPEFYNSNTNSAPGAFYGAQPGAGNFDLRGLGTVRTLTLLNGRRIVGSTRYGSTDVNTFPKEMIKSVEAVTGGASAAYGTDAVTGVVNFILDTSFTGVRGHLQGGITSRGDNKNWEGSIAGGTSLFGDKVHVLASYEQYEQNPIYSYEDRDWYQGWGLVSNPSPGPTFVRLPNLISSTANLDGVATIAGTKYQFLPDGSFVPFTPNPIPAAQGGTNSQQGFSQLSGDSGVDNGAERTTVQPETDRRSVFGYVEYNPWDNLMIFAQGIFGQNELVQTNAGGTMNGFSPLTIYQGNAFLPSALNTAMMGAGQASFTLGRIGSKLDTAAEAFTITENEMWSLTGGFEYRFLEDGLFGSDWFKDWRASGYYQRGHNSSDAKHRGGFRIDRYALAADAVDDGSGNIICRVNLPQFAAVNGGRWSDCVPFDPFGRGQASPAAVDWLTGYDEGLPIGPVVLTYTDSGTSLGVVDQYTSTSEKISNVDLGQNVIEITFDGDVWEGWGAGAISGAFGYSYRTERINQVVRNQVDPTNDVTNNRPVPANDAAGCTVGVDCMGVRGNPAGNVNNSVAIQFSKVPNVAGSLYTGEVFSEILIPVVADLPFIELFSVNGAARRAEYSGSGQIWAWKYGFSWQVTDDLRLRGAQSRDVRAATLGERFDQTGGLATPIDPCSTCLVLGGVVVPAGTPGAAIPGAYNSFLVSGGNPNVSPERADTTTLGIVYQPSWSPWLDGLSISVDWYDIRLSGQIALFTFQQVVDGCFAGDASLCARITRDPGLGLNAIGQPRINIINASYLNLNKSRVSGIDTQIDYGHDISLFGGDESVSARIFASYLDENSFTNVGAARVQRAGGFFGSPAVTSYPRWKWTIGLTYNNGPFSVYVQERYIDKMKLNVQWTEGVQVADNTVDPAFYTDVNFAYDIERFDGDWTLYLNVQNLLDFDPPVVPATFSSFTSSAGSGTFPSTYDLLGRRFTAGIRFSF